MDFSHLSSITHFISTYKSVGKWRGFPPQRRGDKIVGYCGITHLLSNYNQINNILTQISLELFNQEIVLVTSPCSNCGARILPLNYTIHIVIQTNDTLEDVHCNPDPPATGFHSIGFNFPHLSPLNGINHGSHRPINQKSLF